MPRSLEAQLHLEHALARHRALLDRATALPGRRSAGPARSGFLQRLHERLAPAAPRPAEAEGATLRSEQHRYRVRPGDTLWALAVERFHVPVEELARQNGIRDPRNLRPGRLLTVHRSIDGTPRRVVASWYGPGFDGRPMANGKPYDRFAATIAHRTLPLGTEVELRNPESGVVIRARVEDRGPYVAGREVDLSWRLAHDLGILEAGVGSLEMRILG